MASVENVVPKNIVEFNILIEKSKINVSDEGKEESKIYYNKAIGSLYLGHLSKSLNNKCEDLLKLQKKVTGQINALIEKFSQKSMEE